ncbi:aliphatic sulfonate ABC transporter permease SsuC [Xylanibacillus composti]|uniref:Sulfonate ABC transporter n=1 Tax=Xylanibacillus composti TaxID=1572762 RepID=A0A8J4H269_9BACL|nr:aliphatic sulfonate ABC transporter permease SsuC [Xylanibacillus composti]MDT9726981.1 aliphatic sulfonate ABC transporter permease SsuC [Xylanibacillus composti]GIQ69539.1 sulfonate ABC transporter [Xylanibacillus composti]
MGNRRKNWAHAFIPWLLPLLFLTIWQAAGSLGWIDARTVSTPYAVLAALVRLSAEGDLFHYIAVSSSRAFLGFLIGASAGFVLGLVNGLFPLIEKATDTSVQMIRNIPHLALIPLVILWFGIGEEAKIFLVALGVLFPIYLNTFHGIRMVDKGLIEMARVYGLNGFALFRNVILPGALTNILVGIRFALGIMWMTLIVAETISADSGIGYMAMDAREFMRMDVVILSILLYALLGKLSDMLAKLLEQRWLRWHPGYHTSK